MIVFVSHSSKDRELTERVVAALVGEGLRVLVDYQELKPGVEWPKRIHVMMAKCHAAVILLTADAIASPWVLKEATILAWRRSLSARDSFKCIPFVASPADSLRLENTAFGPLGLKDLQWGHSLDAASIAKTVRELAPPSPPKSLFDELLGRLSDHLRTAGENTLVDVAERLRVNAPTWRGNEDIETARVEDVAAAILMGHLGDYDGIDALIDDISQGTAPADTLRMILKWAAPAWIDLETAGRLRLAAEQPNRRCFGINGRHVHTYTASMLAQRAHPLTDRLRVIATAGGDAGNVVDHVAREICEQLKKFPGFTDSCDQIVAALERATTPYYVVVGPPIPDNQALRDLRSRFPKLSFLLCTGDSLATDPDLTNVEWLRENLSLEREADEYMRYQNAQALVKARADER